MYCSEIVDFRPPYLYLALPLGVSPVEYLQDIIFIRKPESGLSYDIISVILRLAVLIVEL